MTRIPPCLLLSFLLLAVSPVLRAQTDPFAAPKKGFSSWQPAPNWEQALLTGNGTMGAMVMGQPHDETIILNHAGLYMPIYEPLPPIDQAGRLPEIRSLILAGKYEEAAKIPVEQSMKEGYGGHRWSNPYVPAFDVRLQLDPSNVARYSRMVDFETAEAKVVWTDANGTFERKTFISRPDSVVVISLKGTGKINGKVAFARRPVEWTQWQTLNENVGSVDIAALDNWLIYRSDFKKRWPGSLQGYEGAGRVIVKGGSATTANGEISINGADEVLVLIRINTSYNYAQSQVAQLKTYLTSLPADYEALRNRHGKVHGALFNAVKLDLEDGPDGSLYSEALVQKTRSGHVSPAIIEKEFNAARYNIICATGANPPNLQGIWGGSWTPPWSADFTHDGNVEVAVSALLSGHNPELLLAYFDYHDKRLPYYRDNARRMFGTRGIHVPSHTSSHGWDNHFDPIWCLSLWTGGAGWTANFYNDYWLYTGDKTFLKNRAYPFMKEAALFYEDFLTVGKDGRYVFNPSYSPENTPKNSNSQASINATMDVMIARQLLRNCIAAAQTLKTDKAEVKKWQEMLTRMPEYTTDKDGTLKEWLWPTLENNHQHRHVSHLYALYDQVDPDFKNNPGLMQAAKRVVEEHMDFRRKENGGEMVFGLAQMAFVTANMEDAATTAELIDWLARYYWTTGMGTYHNPGSLFNTDLSGGFPSAVMRTLAYSEPGLVKLLPALPATWHTGQIEGMLLRGQIELKNLSWDGKQVNVTLHSDKSQQIQLQVPQPIQSIKAVAGKAGKLKAGSRTTTLTLPAGQDVQFAIVMQ